MTLLHKLALIGVGAAIMALALTLVANPHALGPGPCGVAAKRWSAMSLTEQRKLSTCNLRHSRFAQQFVRENRRLYSERTAERLIAAHQRLAVKARRNLRAIDHALYVRSLWPWCRSGECVKTLIRRIFVEDPEGAVTVAGCESGWHADPVDGLSMTGQFVGVLQLGTEARAEAGHVGSGLYASSDPWTAIKAPAWEQITAAHIFWLRHGWSRWQCSPSGGLRW